MKTSNIEILLSKIEHGDNLLKQAFEHRVNELKHKKSFQKYLYKKEFELEEQCYNDFFEIGSKENIVEKIIIKTKETIDTITSTLEKTLCTKERMEKFLKKNQQWPYNNSHNQEYFFNIKLNVNKEQYECIKNAYIHTDSHTSKHFPPISKPEFFLGDISDRGLPCCEEHTQTSSKPISMNASFILEEEEEEEEEEEKIHEKEPNIENIDTSDHSLFQLKKTIYLISRNLIKNTKTICFIINNKNIPDNFTFSTLGNHDYGQILSQDLYKTIEESNLNDNNLKLIDQLINDIDYISRMIIPTQIVMIGPEESNLPLLIMSHSGGESLLPDKCECETLAKNNNMELSLVDYDLFGDKTENIKNLLAENKENFNALTIENFIYFFLFEDFYKQKNKINIHTWCDFKYPSLFFCEDYLNMDDSKSRYQAPLSFSKLFACMTNYNYKIKYNPSHFKFRGHQHDANSLKTFFSEKSFHITSCGDKKHKLIFFAPHFFDNQYGEGFQFGTEEIIEKRLSFQKISAIEEETDDLIDETECSSIETWQWEKMYIKKLENEKYKEEYLLLQKLHKEIYTIPKLLKTMCNCQEGMDCDAALNKFFWTHWYQSGTTNDDQCALTILKQFFTTHYSLENLKYLKSLIKTGKEHDPKRNLIKEIIDTKIKSDQTHPNTQLRNPEIKDEKSNQNTYFSFFWKGILLIYLAYLLYQYKTILYDTIKQWCGSLKFHDNKKPFTTKN